MQELQENLQQDLLNENENVINTLKGGKKKRKQSKSKKNTKKTKGKKRKGTRKRGASKWINHVMSYAKKHRIKFPEALKSAACKAEYKKL